MDTTQKTEQEKTDAAAETEAKAAETKAAETKVAAEKAASESRGAKQEAEAVKTSEEFDKKADSDEQSATETAEKDAKAKADEEASEEAEKTRKEDGKSKENLLLRAEQAGMVREKAEQFSSKEDLERAIGLLEESQSKTKQPEETEAEKKAKEEAETKVKDKAKDDEAPYECGLNPDEYDDGLIKSLNDLGTMLKKRIVALEGDHSEHTKILSDNRVTKHTEWLDSRVNRLTDELKDVYGTGDIDDIDGNSEQFKARAALDVKIASIATEFRTAKKTVPSRNKLFDMAIEALHKGKTKKVDTKTAGKLEARANQALGPGSGKVSAESAEQAALKLQKDFDAKVDE